MATPTTRQELIDWALRSLGDDVIEINISEDQAEDRLDEALQFFQEYHFDGVEKVYLKHQVVPSKIKLTTNVAGNFAVDEIVTGQTSGVSFKVYGTDGANYLTTRVIGGTLTAGETLLGETSATTAIVATLSSAADVVIGDIENRWIPVDDLIIGIAKVMPLNQSFSGSQFNMFDVRYQIMLNDMYSLTNISMTYYTQVQSHLSMINFFLNPETTFQFTRHQNRLHLNIDWDDKVKPNDWFVVEAYGILDPTEWPDVWNDRMLKEYYVALLKKQWGNNLKKFEGMVMPGGVTLNGQQIYNEAVAEIEAIRQSIRNDHQLPVDFMVG